MSGPNGKVKDISNPNSSRLLCPYRLSEPEARVLTVGEAPTNRQCVGPACAIFVHELNAQNLPTGRGACAHLMAVVQAANASGGIENLVQLTLRAMGAGPPPAGDKPV